MIKILSVTQRSTRSEIAMAQTLFRHYAEFLRAISACHGFNFERFAEEVAALPTPFAGQGGELLVAMQDDAETDRIPVGCIAYRRAMSQTGASVEHQPSGSGDPRPAKVCELKRLFVLPEARGQQLGQMLVQEALDRARQRGYQTAVLDTEPSSMGAAYRIYARLGFTEFQPTSASRGGGPTVTYLRRPLG